MLWSKQIYLWDVNLWLEADVQTLRRLGQNAQARMRNVHWRRHLNSMRDAVDAPSSGVSAVRGGRTRRFRCIALALVGPGCAKENLWILLFEQFPASRMDRFSLWTGILGRKDPPVDARLGLLARVSAGARAREERRVWRFL